MSFSRFTEYMMQRKTAAPAHAETSAIRKACASPSEDGEHMGIANVKERLETCFGPEAGFVIESEPGRFMRTRITIPMEEEADAENSDRGR